MISDEQWEELTKIEKGELPMASILTNYYRDSEN
jgi:hypothetical protein